MTQKRILRIGLVSISCLGIFQSILVTPSFGAEQAIKKKSYCTQVQGKLKANPYKYPGSLPYICVYPSKYDQKCKRQLDGSAYYDIVQRKCVSEFRCDEYDEC